MDIKKNLFSVITTLLTALGKDFLRAVAPEVFAAYRFWDEERKTPDGVTEVEYLNWLNGAIGRVRKQQIGGKWADYVGDWALQSLQMKINKRLDEIEVGEEIPADEPKPPVKDYYGKLFSVKPDPALYDVDGDKLWSNNSPSAEAVVYTITDSRATMAWPGWTQVQW